MRVVLLVAIVFSVGCAGEEEGAAEAAPTHAIETTPQEWLRVTLDPLGGSHMAPRPIHLLIPEGEAPENGFPFLVVTDGDLAFTDIFAVDVAVRSLVDEGAMPPCVVVAVPAIERTEELRPSLASRRSLRRGERLESPRSGVEAFADFVVGTVLAAVAEEVSIADEGAIFGYSYGGLAALHFALRYPDRFPHVIAMSPSLWFAQRAALFAAVSAERLPRRIWLDVGTREGDPNEAIPYMVADARQLQRDLRQRGVEVGYYEVVGRNHGSQEAAPRMRDALRYVFGEADCAPTTLELHPFRRQARVGQLVPTTALGACADGSPRTIAPRDVRYEVEGGRVTQDGHIRASRAGIVRIRAFALGLEAETGLRFR